jgi:multiple sugar transport system ATP-binding protein
VFTGLFMAEISLDNVSKVYQGGVHAVRDLSLRIANGEFVALVGPSGCGKTTTLRMIAGLEEVSSGTVSIGGRIVNDVHPRDRDIAMVFQNYALYPHMTIERNLSFALRMRKVPKDEIRRRVEQTAHMLGIEDLLSRKPRQLSGGQRQRVAVGRAIIREPKAFLFDEPLSNLDARLRLATRAELKALHQRLKTTTVYVTHDQEEAMTLGDRIVVMARGLIQQAGPPLEVYRRPANRFVAGFIGSPPMNFIHGRIVDEAGSAFFVEDRDDRGGAAARIPISLSLRPRAGTVAVLGIRPQAIIPATSDPSFDLHIRIVEPLGDAIDLHGSTSAGAPIVARVPSSHAARAGDRLPCRVDPDSIHLFEPGELGRNLLV